MRPRIRTVKPEAHMDERLWDLEQDSGLPIFRAFVGLWNWADREGRFEWRARPLKAGILPYWDGDFEACLIALAGAGMIVKYEVDGRGYGVIPSFGRHQAINQREAKSELPEPPVDVAQHQPANIPQDVRETVIDRDGQACTRCASTDDLTIDHILPRSMGGPHEPENLRVMCRKCNSARPVQGEALDADLARDGYSLEKLRATFLHVHARGEGKGREGKGASRHATRSPPGSIGKLAEYIRAGVETGYRSLKQPAPRECSGLTWDGWATLARWVAERAELTGRPVEETAQATVRAFLRSPKAKKLGWPITFLVQNPAEYTAEAEAA